MELALQILDGAPLRYGLPVGGRGLGGATLWALGCCSMACRGVLGRAGAAESGRLDVHILGGAPLRYGLPVSGRTGRCNTLGGAPLRHGLPPRLCDWRGSGVEHALHSLLVLGMC